MRSYQIGVLAGDGIGPEITRATLSIVAAALRQQAEVTIDWRPLPMGWEAIRAGDTAMPEATKTALAACDGWIMGPHDSASYPAAERQRRNPSGELRHHFDLYANIRPAHGWPGVPAVAPRADLLIVRENTEEFYPTAICTAARASGCQPPIWPSRSGSSRGARRGGSPRSPVNLPRDGGST